MIKYDVLSNVLDEIGHHEVKAALLFVIVRVVDDVAGQLLALLRLLQVRTLVLRQLLLQL